MNDMAPSAGYSELRRMLVEASQALARLDADRLEEMAHYCEALVSNIDLPAEQGCASRFSSGEAGRALFRFKRVLNATGANRTILRSLCGGTSAPLEYRPLAAGAGSTVEGPHGDH
jgi:hypothetical protein